MFTPLYTYTLLLSLGKVALAAPLLQLQARQEPAAADLTVVKVCSPVILLLPVRVLTSSPVSSLQPWQNRSKVHFTPRRSKSLVRAESWIKRPWTKSRMSPGRVHPTREAGADSEETTG